MNVKSICKLIEDFAPLSLQENYDNAGLLVGDSSAEVEQVLVTIDVTEAVIDEAITHGCNLIVAHHPLIFSGLKKIVGSTEVQRCIIKAIKNDIAIYAAHTNLDNVRNGVSGRMAEKLSLENCTILETKEQLLLKLITYVPRLQSYAVRQALFDAGAGQIGNYDSCSFNVEGTGTFRANEQAKPFVGELLQLHSEPEVRIEVILPSHLKESVRQALLNAHPYEEPAYDFILLQNQSFEFGSGIIGELQQPEDEITFLNRLKIVFQQPMLRHTALTGRKIKRIALCGGAGSFLLPQAIACGADIYISGDFKYHDFFNAENRILIADIGHFESEQFTKEIFFEIITKKMPKFAVRISDIKTNPINYL